MRYSKLAFLLGNLWLMVAAVMGNYSIAIIGIAWILASFMMEIKEIKTLRKKYGDETKSADTDKGKS